MQTVNVDVEIVQISEKAVLVTDGCGDPVWLPRNLVRGFGADTNTGDTLTIEIPEWLAWKSGLV